MELLAESAEHALIPVDLVELREVAPVGKADSLSVSFASDELTDGVGRVKKIEVSIVGTIVFKMGAEDLFDFCHWMVFILNG